MDLPSILLALTVFLGATAVCVILFEHLGYGSILGFIVAGIIIGPHTPGPVATQNVADLQHVAELGVVLFMFTIGLELRPEKVWAMRRLLFGLGSAQMLLTALLLGTYFLLVVETTWQSALILGLGFAMSSTAIVMSTLVERGELTSEHGQTAFAILMAQDLWIVPVMALVPIMAQRREPQVDTPMWETALLVVAAIGGILVIGRYLLPAILGYTAKQRRMEAFGLVVFLAVIAAAWAVEHAGISMTLGAFLMGMLLSASDYRYQIEATVAPFKGILMALFFVAVGMSIDVAALMQGWSKLVTHVPALLFLKVALLIALAMGFGISRSAAIRTGFFMSQFGELAFVLFGAAAVAGLLHTRGLTLAMLAVAISMILTPLMVKAGNRLASRMRAFPKDADALPAADLIRHVVVVGYEEVGQLICLMLDKADIPYVAFDRNINRVQKGKQSGRDVHFGNLYSDVTQQAAGLGKAAAVYVTMADVEDAKALAVTLHRLYPHLDVYVLVRTLADQDELAGKGVKRAGTAYIASTLLRGSQLLKDLGVSEADVNQLVKTIQQDNYALLRAAHVEQARQ